MDIRLLCFSLLRSRKHGATSQKNIRHSIPFYNTRTWTRTWTWANATCSKGGVQNDLAISDTFGLHHDAESPPPDFWMPIHALDVKHAVSVRLAHSRAYRNGSSQGGGARSGSGHSCMSCKRVTYAEQMARSAGFSRVQWAGRRRRRADSRGCAAGGTDAAETTHRGRRRSCSLCGCRCCAPLRQAISLHCAGQSCARHPLRFYCATCSSSDDGCTLGVSKFVGARWREVQRRGMQFCRF